MKQKSSYFKNLPLGEKFVVDSIIYQVKLANTCEGCSCWSSDAQICMDFSCRFPRCFSLVRPDNKDVIFVKIGEL